MARRSMNRLVGIIVVVGMISLAYYFWFPLVKHRSAIAIMNSIKS